MKVFLSVFSAFLMLTVAASAAPIPDTDSMPSSLEPWKPWVLHGEEERFCPTSYNDGEMYRCVWPSVLDLDIDQRGGRFTQQWVGFIKGWVPLPGGQKQWPLNVKVDEKTVPVVGKGGMPSVYMTPGKHRVGAWAPGIFWSGRLYGEKRHERQIEKNIIFPLTGSGS